MEFLLLNVLLKVFLFLKVCDSDQVEQEAMVWNTPSFIIMIMNVVIW